MKYSCFARMVVLLLIIEVTTFCSLSSAEDASNAMADKLAELCRKHNVPAMTAAIVNPDGRVDTTCFGVRKRGTSEKVSLSDRFPLGSNTKSMTATLAAALVEAGKIDWTTTIGEVWPKATDDVIHPKLRTVTLDQLLSHQSGLPGDVSEISNQAWANFFQEKQSPVLERRTMLKVVIAKAPSQPQGKFAYSNLGFAIASGRNQQRSSSLHCCGDIWQMEIQLIRER